MKIFRIFYLASSILILLAACSTQKTAYAAPETQGHSGYTTTYGAKGKIFKTMPETNQDLIVATASLENVTPSPIDLEENEVFADDLYASTEVIVQTEKTKTRNTFTTNVVNNYNEIEKSYKKHSTLNRIFNKDSKQSATQTASGSSASSVLAIAGLVFAIIGLFTYGLLFGIIAVIFSVLGLSSSLKALAIAGLIIGILDIVLVLIAM